MICDNNKNKEVGEKDLKIVDLENKLEEEKKKSEEYLNNWKRAQADFINYRRRESELFEDMMDSQKASLIMELIPIYETLGLAVEHFPKEMEKSEWAMGVCQIKIQLESILKKKGLEEIKSVGEKFNPDVHDAVDMVESEKPEGEILEEVQKGFKLNGKLVRAAKVRIAKKMNK